MARYHRGGCAEGGIRPDQVRLARDDPAPVGWLDFEVCEQFGTTTPRPEWMYGQAFRALVPRTVEAAGERLSLSQLPEHLHFFNAATGLRLRCA